MNNYVNILVNFLESWDLCIPFKCHYKTQIRG